MRLKGAEMFEICFRIMFRSVTARSETDTQQSFCHLALKLSGFFTAISCIVFSDVTMRRRELVNHVIYSYFWKKNWPH